MTEENKDADWGSPGEEWTGAEVQQYIKDQFTMLREAIENGTTKAHAPITFKAGDNNAVYVIDVALANQEGDGDEDIKIPDGSETLTKGYDFINKDYGLERGGTNYLSTASLMEDVMTIELSKSDGNGWRLWTDGLRVYKGTAQLELSVPDNYAITKISLNGSAASFVTASGYDLVSKAWTGVSKRVSFTINPGATKSLETVVVELVKLS